MKRSKKSLKLKKIRIANMNLIKGGSDEDPISAGVVVCQSEDPKIDCQGTRYEASTPGNLCSETCITNQPDTRTIFMSNPC